MKKTLLVIATLLWLGIWWWWYTCKICTTCACNKTESITAPALIPESGIILFNKGDSNALPQPGWAFYRDSLIAALSNNQTITIDGHYIASENNTSTFENMGLARANEIRKLFPDSLHSRIKLNSLLVSERPTMNAHPFLAHNFNIITQSEKIEQVGDKSLVYFNFNSDQRIKDAEIEAYLSKLAEANKLTRSTFNITGHTDNIGTPSENLKLGMKRAEAIKSYLVSKGIAAERITANTLGDTAPVESNETPEGRKKNRRTEIELLNKQ